MAASKRREIPSIARRGSSKRRVPSESSARMATLHFDDSTHTVAWTPAISTLGYVGWLRRPASSAGSGASDMQNVLSSSPPTPSKGRSARPRSRARSAAGSSAPGDAADLCPVPTAARGRSTRCCPSLAASARASRPGPARRPVRTGFGLVEDGGTAIVEMAMASGLGLIAEESRRLERVDLWHGRAYRRRGAAGAAVILVAVGGSATTDGGAGAIEAIEEAAASAARRSSCCATCARRSRTRRRSSGRRRRRRRDGRAARGSGWTSWRRRFRATRAACR